jgi:uncharacterized membrane protein
MSAPQETLRTAVIAAEDLPSWLPWTAAAVVAIGLLLLVLELRRAREARRVPVVLSALLAAAALLGAVLRPQRLRAREVNMAPRVVVLVDRSRSMALSSTDKADGEPRIDVAERVARELRGRVGGRIDVASFGVGAARPEPPGRDDGKKSALARADLAGSDLATAVRSIAERHDDPPAALIVVSDGRLDVGELAERRAPFPIHAVAIGDGSPKDASIRAVRLAGAAVAHQALPLRIEVACTGGISCGDLTVTVRELREREPGAKDDEPRTDASAILAGGTATVRDGTATIELPITLERAGTRAIEVALAAPKDDAIPEDDRRLLSIDVARERVRVLHIAGRPTYDVRALRTWLKSDAAMDVVSFFILRTPGDDVNAPDEELALIPFPVRELFTEYLPTFDAVVIQDFDADPYGLTPHLPAIARYVEHGGGLVHIGGPNAFSAGGYAGSPLARVTPAEIPKLAADKQPADTSAFVPVESAAARGAPILQDLHAVIGDELPEFPGTNVLGDLQHGGVALWTHPKRTTPKGNPMPVLSIADIGDGRSIALGLDSTRILAFSPYAAKTGGRAFDGLFRGLLGWLMRDPRYEPVRGRLVHEDGVSPCLAGANAALRLDASPIAGPSHLRAALAPLDPPRAREGEGLPAEVDRELESKPPSVVPLGVAPVGSWALRLAVGEKGAEPSLGALATRTLGVCERGGDEWADPRPDRPTLEKIAKVSGGVVTKPGDLGALPTPKAAVVALERSVAPLLPTWAWAAIAAVALGAHWFVRRRSGLS